MKITRLLVLLTVGMFLSGCILDPNFPGQDRSFPGQQSRLEGTWYSGGARDRATSIVSTRDGLEVRNENGQTSRLVSDGSGFVRALDWEGGLRGEIRNDRIEWANGTFWTRGSGQDRSFPGQRSLLEGTWYSGGARDRAASIVSTRDGLEARSENGQTSRLVSDGSGFVRALDWEGGLRGEIRNDRIVWTNGTFWTRRPDR